LSKSPNKDTIHIPQHLQGFNSLAVSFDKDDDEIVEEAEQEEQLTGLLLVDQTLNDLTKDKFTRIKRDTEMEELEDDKAYKLNAKAIQEFNEVIENSMN
jgi:hypothetical protein